MLRVHLKMRCSTSVHININKSVKMCCSSEEDENMSDSFACSCAGISHIIKGTSVEIQRTDKKRGNTVGHLHKSTVKNSVIYLN